MAKYTTLKASKEAHDILIGLNRLTGLNVQVLVEVAIMNLTKIDFTEIKKLKESNEAQYQKALERLSKDLPTTVVRSNNISMVSVHIDPAIKTGGVKDPTDPLDIIIKDRPIGRPKQEIKLTMPEKAATRVDEALSNSNGLVPELDIDDILSTEE